MISKVTKLVLDDIAKWRNDLKAGEATRDDRDRFVSDMVTFSKYAKPLDANSLVELKRECTDDVSVTLLDHMMMAFGITYILAKITNK